MGFDIHIHLFGGFKIPLSEAFDSNLLSPKIMDEDDYQLITEDEYKNELINTHVLSEDLRNILLDEQSSWNIYIVTSSQEDFDYDKSYLILYNCHQDLINGKIPDYQVGSVIDIGCDRDTMDIWEKITRIRNSLKWEYKMHWVVESSY